jgi:hypothetical protein
MIKFIQRNLFSLSTIECFSDELKPNLWTNIWGVN